MKAEYKGRRGSWKQLYRSCLNTIGKETSREPNDNWKLAILLAEHSPIRKLNFEVKLYDLPYWVSNHFVRHKHGVEHFVSTQRTDRVKVNRCDKPQDAPVDHEMDFNAQAMINMSRKRLCHTASPETRIAWTQTIKEVAKVEPVMKEVCVKECVYRGFCPEMFSCGYTEKHQEQFQKELAAYRKGRV